MIILFVSNQIKKRNIIFNIEGQADPRIEKDNMNHGVAKHTEQALCATD